MSIERKLTNEERFRGVHESTVRDLRKLPAPNLDFFRKRFEEGDFDASEAYFVGTWLVHTHSRDHRRLGLAYMSQAVELNPKKPRYRWALRHESKASTLAADIVPVIEPSKDFLDYAEIARLRKSGTTEIIPRRKKRDRRKKGSIWSHH